MFKTAYYQSMFQIGLSDRTRHIFN